MIINKKEFIDVFSKRYDYTKQTSETIYDEICDFFTWILTEGHELHLISVLKLYTKTRCETKGRNPITGEVEIRPPKIVPKCEFREQIKQIISEKEAVLKSTE